MGIDWRGWWIGPAGLLGLLIVASPARAVEYRLQVVSMYESAFASFLTSPDELEDGAAGPGLDRLEASLDQGAVPDATLLGDRPLQLTRDRIGRAWGGVRVIPDVRQAGEDRTLWDVGRWEGKPGERSVWVITAGTMRPQELYRVALKGSGPLRHFQPYTLPGGSAPVAVVKYPLNLLWFAEDRGTIWDKYVSRSLDLGRGIGAVVGENTNPSFPDQVYLIVSQGAEPATYKAVLVWRQRQSDREAPKVLQPR